MTGTGEWDMQYLLTVQLVSVPPHIRDPLSPTQVNVDDNAPGNTPHARTEGRTDALEQLLLPPCTDDERVRSVECNHAFNRVRNLARDEFDDDGELAPAIFELGILLLDEPH